MDRFASIRLSCEWPRVAVFQLRARVTCRRRQSGTRCRHWKTRSACVCRTARPDGVSLGRGSHIGD